MLRALAPYLGYLHMTFVGWTTRLCVYGNEHRVRLRAQNQRFIYAFWHNRQVFFTYSHRGDGLSVLVSQSRDGEIIAKVMELSRIVASRGSSSKGASAAIRDMMAVVERGLEIGITPDGPKGPVYEVKPGVLFLALKLGIPILPSTNAVSRKLVLKKSWDQYQVPLPFSRSVIRYGAPIWVRPGDDLKEKARELKASLDEITRLADEEAEGKRASQAPGFFPILRSHAYPSGHPKTEPLPWLTRASLLALTAAAPAVAAAIAAKFALSPRRGALKSLPSELRERRGLLPPETLAKLAGRKTLWVHAASAGEVSAVEPLLRDLAARPDPPAVLLTTSTAAGRGRAQSAAGVDAAALAPIDAAWTVRRLIASVRPYALVLVETELWPNTIAACAENGVKVAVVNGRVSERAFGRYLLAARALRPILQRITGMAVQTEADAERFRALGAMPERVHVVGNLKNDQLAPVATSEEVDRRLAALGWTEKPIFVAGSTHPGEEVAVTAAYLRARETIPDLKLVIAPRHVERSDGAAATIAAENLSCARWSQGTGDEVVDVFLVDVLGRLPSFYARARAAFVGGTLVPVGGHNLFEPALLGRPVLFGPHHSHAQDAAERLIASGGGFEVSGAESLAQKIGELCRGQDAAEEAGRRAAQAARAAQGAVQRTLERLADVLLSGA